ncbi:MAG: ferrochelatase [Sphingomonadales bacterium 35-56-22]|jgi:ferrochelatase|uniref:ferrochelatase n=1 Tax=Sphingorhabdus sp. TaxID=1902408 RepID=UPI000BC851CC|nr:ferrochelatase [Sphingorhabdus sp.]OYY15661.1 MAG: ferrochelatase [Sphingomonadales bacterium 35-56-22]OYY98061.1 MAG: ferrochelatase [Sphingomonadales bacterium 28-56-43]OYZ60544.1 MAG: ferrochelatase [Sphingomonadales bacterium 24-56-14]OZA83018.1 MAG: ferrochelatase [Sphingomonadales bacterium 39-57-19]HQS13225.1 ferrochelatase [Sphingorhabdus sp.]
MTLPTNHPPVATPKVGVLLVNLGTPDAPTTSAVKRYLKQFLSDRRVVEIPPLLWQPILRGIILNTRPQKSAKAYAKVWTEKGSPLAFFTAGQAEALQARMEGIADVRYAMRYGNPSVADQLAAMKAAGCNRILIAPLYPQYSGATTGTVLDEAYATLTAMRWHPAIRTLPAYHDDARYIGALKSSIEASLAKLDFVPDALVISFHGMPERTLHLGDPYHCHCQKTARLLSEAMGRALVVSFQSRFGRAKWLEPATDDTLMKLAREGTKKVAIFAPGFSVDCLETLEELAMQGHEQFEEAGGTHYAYLPCLNDSDIGMDMLEQIIGQELAGWI